MSDTGIGARVKRKEDQRFITGKGRYTDDINLKGQTYAYFVRSPHAHAAIKSLLDAGCVPYAKGYNGAPAAAKPAAKAKAAPVARAAAKPKAVAKAAPAAAAESVLVVGAGLNQFTTRFGSLFAPGTQVPTLNGSGGAAGTFSGVPGVNSTVFSVPKVEIITVTLTNTTPAGPITSCATSAATSLEWRMVSTGSTARYARLAAR